MKNRAAGEGRFDDGQKGLIKAIVIIVIALLIVSYLGINLKALVTSPTTQDNLSYVTTAVMNLWNNYLKTPVMYLWNELFIKLIWNTALENLKNGDWSSPPAVVTGTPTPTPMPAY